MTRRPGVRRGSEAILTSAPFLSGRFVDDFLGRCIGRREPGIGPSAGDKQGELMKYAAMRIPVSVFHLLQDIRA